MICIWNIILSFNSYEILVGLFYYPYIMDTEKLRNEEAL